MKNRFGTKSDMIIQAVEENGKSYLLAIDARGLYLTTQSRLDTGMADTNRYEAARWGIAGRLATLGLDSAALAAANQHLIKVEAADARRVNPLKASKRASKSA